MRMDAIFPSFYCTSNKCMWFMVHVSIAAFMQCSKDAIYEELLTLLFKYNELKTILNALIFVEVQSRSIRTTFY